MTRGGPSARPRRTWLALGLLDRPAAWLPAVPEILVDSSYGPSVTFRLALEERGWSYLMAVDPNGTARPAAAEPFQPISRVSRSSRPARNRRPAWTA